MIGTVVRQITHRLGIKRLYLLYTLPLLAAFSLLSVIGVFDRPNLFFLDRAFNLRGTQDPDPAVTIVAISQEDFERGAPRWPWPRSLMARLVDEIAEQNPAVIAMDIIYSEKTYNEVLITRDQFKESQPYLYQALAGVNMEVRNENGIRVIGPGNLALSEAAVDATSGKAQDQELADAVSRAMDAGIRVVLAAHTVSGLDIRGLTLPYPSLAQAISGDSRGSLGLVGVRMDRDGVLRHYLPYGVDQNSRFIYGFALNAVAAYQEVRLPQTPAPGGDVIIGGLPTVRVNDGEFMVNYPGPPGTHPTITAWDIFRGGDEFAGDLAGKLVFIGVTDPSAEDLVPTPYSGTDRMSGVEFQAAAADTMLKGSYITEMPGYQVVLVVWFLGASAVALGRFVKPAFGITGGLALTAGLFAGWWGGFSAANYEFPMAAPLAALATCYAVAITDRVGIEQLAKQQARSMLSRYLPSEVVTEMIKDPKAAQLGARRAMVTVLFSDIRGFTTASEKMSPEEVVELLNEYLTVMTEVVFSHEGTIDKFVGDAILAFFGAPQAHHDDPERAVRCALDMRDQLAMLDHNWHAHTQVHLEIGIGINTGPVMVGNIGSQRRMDYTVIGDTVNLASRLQDLTQDYSAPILISGAVKTKANNCAQMRFVDAVQVRGREQTLEVYEVTGRNSDGPDPVK